MLDKIESLTSADVQRALEKHPGSLPFVAVKAGTSSDAECLSASAVTVSSAHCHPGYVSPRPAGPEWIKPNSEDPVGLLRPRGRLADTRKTANCAESQVSGWKGLRNSGFLGAVRALEP
jgi:hypothetical protein